MNDQTTEQDRVEESPVEPSKGPKFEPSEREQLITPRGRYTLRVPTVFDRMKIKRDVETQGVPAVTDEEIREFFIEGIKQILKDEPESLDRNLNILKRVDEIKAEMAEMMEGDPELPKLRDELVGLMILVRDTDRVLRQHYPPYARLQASRSYFLDIWNVMAAKYCVIEAELGDWHDDPDTEERRLDVKKTFKQKLKRGHLSDAQLDAIPTADYEQLGLSIALLMEVGDKPKKSNGPSII